MVVVVATVARALATVILLVLVFVSTAVIVIATVARALAIAPAAASGGGNDNAVTVAAAWIIDGFSMGRTHEYSTSTVIASCNTMTGVLPTLLSRMRSSVRGSRKVATCQP